MILVSAAVKYNFFDSGFQGFFGSEFAYCCSQSDFLPLDLISAWMKRQPKSSGSSSISWT
jgi:hypothetical protein